MKERPIIFSAPMVRAILAGKKTQTRRIAKSYKPPCEVGDRLWVRETWLPYPGQTQRVQYAANYEAPMGPWKSPIFMPRRYSRILLEVEEVRKERLHAINRDDLYAEGIGSLFEPARKSFKKLWDSIHGKGAWEANPPVWVISFRRVDK